MSGSGLDEWKQRITKIATTYQDDKQTFVEHLVKHVNEAPSKHKFYSTINMFAISLAIDGEDFNIFSIGNYWPLMERLDHFEEKLRELRAKDGDGDINDG